MNNISTFNDLTIIIPTLNEEGNIQPLIQELNNILPGAFIIVVDDSSSDNTPRIVRDLSLNSSQILLIERKGKPCLTTSIMTGINNAKTKYIAWMDADFSHPPIVLKKLFRIAQSSGCCIATRYRKEYGDTDKIKEKKINNIQNDTLLSSIFSNTLNFFIYHILRVEITDYTSGFIVCRRDLISKHQLIGDYGEYFIELIYFLNRRGVRVKEVFFKSPPRKYGESKTGKNIFKLLRRGIKYVLIVIRMMLPRIIFRNISLKIKYKKGKLIV